jgi:UTP--glucose-1-phosphate uridylyltransferase
MGSLSKEIINKMKELSIDAELSTRILDNYNAGAYDKFVPIKVTGIPEIDGKSIIDVTGKIEKSYDYKEARARIDALGINIDLSAIGTVKGPNISFDSRSLTKLGVMLYPLLSYGVLNGGSASSYVDSKKNRDFNSVLFDIYKQEFDLLSSISRGKAKGITPAFTNADSSFGPSFLELKMRSILIESLRYKVLTGTTGKALFPMFQMTSVYNDSEILKAYEAFAKGVWLSDLIKETGCNITEVETGVQPMLAALTHSSEGKPKRFFLNAYGKDRNPLPMPGGHGQNFIVLKNVYKKLLSMGKRFVYLGNVDNLGYSINPMCLALMALSGKQAGFEFSFKTTVDSKGGILVIDQNNRLNCADIGVGIPKDEVKNKEKEGKKILFNVATGLFNLEYLAGNIDEVANSLPVRVSDQDKEAGKYSQAEQVTWEIIGILDDPLIFGVNKYTRFLASKFLLEGLMSSGIKLDHPDFPKDPQPEKDLREIASKLSTGLARQLSGTYGLKKEGNSWVPKTAEEILSELKTDPFAALLAIQ